MESSINRILVKPEKLIKRTLKYSEKLGSNELNLLIWQKLRFFISIR